MFPRNRGFHDRPRAAVAQSATQRDYARPVGTRASHTPKFRKRHEPRRDGRIRPSSRAQLGRKRSSLPPLRPRQLPHTQRQSRVLQRNSEASGARSGRRLLSARRIAPWIGDLEMHHTDAEARGVRDGDRIRAFNPRGEIVLKARVDGSPVGGSVPPGVVAARLDWARFSPGGRNINVLTSEKLTDMGNAATFYSVCVEVELFRA